jgi:hypothetical protein
MNRRQFLGAVGAGAMGVAGAAMLGSGVAYAGNNQGDNDQGVTYKVGVLGLDYPYDVDQEYKVGYNVYLAAKYVLEKLGRSKGVRFQVTFEPHDFSDVWGNFLNIKSQADFIIGPNTSGAAGEVIEPHLGYGWATAIEYVNTWKNSCVVTPSADGFVNETGSQEMRDLFRVIANNEQKPFHYHIVGISAYDKNIKFGNRVCEKTVSGGIKIGIIKETGINDPFVDSIVDGIIDGYHNCGGTLLDEETSIKGISFTPGAIRTAITQLETLGVGAIVFASNDARASEVHQALAESGFSGLVFVSGEVGFSLDGIYWPGAMGRVLALDTSTTGTIMGETWDQLKTNSGVYEDAFSPFGAGDIGRIYLAQGFEAAYILGEQIIRNSGNVNRVNDALTQGTYPRRGGLFGGVTWDGSRAFPYLPSGYRVVDLDF